MLANHSPKGTSVGPKVPVCYLCACGCSAVNEADNTVICALTASCCVMIWPALFHPCTQWPEALRPWATDWHMGCGDLLRAAAVVGEEEGAGGARQPTLQAGATALMVTTAGSSSSSSRLAGVLSAGCWRGGGWCGVHTAVGSGCARSRLKIECGGHVPYAPISI